MRGSACTPPWDTTRPFSAAEKLDEESAVVLEGGLIKKIGLSNSNVPIGELVSEVSARSEANKSGAWLYA